MGKDTETAVQQKARVSSRAGADLVPSGIVQITQNVISNCSMRGKIWEGVATEMMILNHIMKLLPLIGLEIKSFFHRPESLI